SFFTTGTGVPGWRWWSRIILALAPVFVTLLAQLTIWPMIRPFAWFLFIPAVFLSAWIGGRWLGMIAAVVATLLISYFFLPAQRSFVVERPAVIASAIVFMGMGIVFSLFYDRLKRTQQRVAEALLAESRYQAQEPVFDAIQDGIVVT